MKNKSLLSALLILSFLFVKTISAQEKTEQRIADPEQFTKEWFEGMFQQITLKDIATAPHRWGFSFASTDKNKIDKFALTLKDKNSIQVGPVGDKFVCSIEDNKIFNAQSLCDRVAYLNNLAKDCGIDHVVAFDLKGDK